MAAARKTDPVKLSRLMRGELDWVVMKCLEKNRSRRYDTASGLARDVERYLKDEPVEARPPSSWYRFSKMVRRNQQALIVAGLVAAVVLVVTAAVLWQAKLANETEAARVADKDRHDRELSEAIAKERRQYALDRAIEAALSGDLDRADKAILKAEEAGVAADRVHWLRGLAYYQQGKLEGAIKEAIQKNCNVDFYSASLQHYMGIPGELFTCVFAASRIAGWCAHVLEQWADNKIIRPSSNYTGPAEREYVSVGKR